MRLTTDQRNARTSAREVAAFKARKRPHQSYTAYLMRDSGPVEGYYLMGRYTSRAWFGPNDKAAAEAEAKRTGARVEASQKHAYRITTWTGETLATVISIKSRPGRHMTETRGSFWARGIDGRLYYGTHNGEGMYCRMHLSKRQTP